MKLASYLLAGAMCAVPLVASAQWQWVDAGGRKVFSDKAPPPDVPEKNILRRPGNMAPRAPSAAATAAAASMAAASAAAPNAAAAPAPAAAASAPPRPVLGQDRELLERTRQAQAQEEAKKKAEADRVAKARAENCDRARKAKAQLDSGIRISRLNSKGEQEIMDDAARATEARAAQQAIDSSCKPAS